MNPTSIFYVWNLLVFGYILKMLITTNHWTKGKKLITALVASFLWYQVIAIYMLTYVVPNVHLGYALLYMTPLSITGTFMALNLWKDHE